MIDHFNLPVRDLARRGRFYARLLEALALRVLGEDGDAVGFGSDTWAFGIVACAAAIPPRHVAFQARDRAAVDAFDQTALALGATPNGAHGIRPAYNADYYAAFVLDPDGRNIEAVCRSADRVTGRSGRFGRLAE